MQRCTDHLLGPDDIGLNRAERTMLAGRHMLERSSMEADIHAGKRSIQFVVVANIAE